MPPSQGKPEWVQELEVEGENKKQTKETDLIPEVSWKQLV